MSMTIAMLDTLVASGASVETIAAMWRVEIAERDARRVKDACRKRDERAIAKEAVSVDIHGQARTAVDSKDGDGQLGQASSRACVVNTNLPSGDNYNIPPLSPQADRKAKTERGTRLPDDWQPTDDDLAFCHSEGLSPEETRRATDEFRDYWHGLPGARGRKLDWSKTFRNRVREVAARKARFAPRSSTSYVPTPEKPKDAPVFIDRDDLAFRKASELYPQAKPMQTKRGWGIYVPPSVASQAKGAAA